ncbi:MAG: WecB/TagA/CpsF family glycosyltransferase [Verrucomicrobiales bacterium]|nr:WecB/TagA/CpsF family glycosyltransferase [Verrucomicrobiales bacterium]
MASSRETSGTVVDAPEEAVAVDGPPRVVLDTALEVTSYRNFTARCHAMARSGGVHSVDFTNTQIVTLRRHDPVFREITSRVDHFVPDGMPLIWCLNRQGAGLRDRVYGPTFMRHCVLASPAPWTHYLLGGSTECLERLQQRLLEANPDVRFVGAQNGYFKPEDEPRILEEINRLSPDFIWVGLGTPKQQDWIHRHKALLRRGVVLAVGFAFDVNAGTKPDAPAWMQRWGLTWVFRVASEPRRLLGRYLKWNSLFLYYLLRDRLSPVRRPAQTPPESG